MDFVRIGTLVEHRTWGRGKVLALSGQNVQAYFPSLASETDGPFRLVREVVLTIAATQSDPALDQITGVPKPKKPKKPKDGEAAKTVGARADGAHATGRRKRLSHDLEKAIHWFEQEYPGGFSNEVLLRTENQGQARRAPAVLRHAGGGQRRTLLDTGPRRQRPARSSTRSIERPRSRRASRSMRRTMA
jgi:hypothetical protein